MSFRFRKKRNRRLDSNYVLNVRQRSDLVRAKRARVTVATLGAFLGLYLVWRIFFFALDLFLYQNPDFALQQILVQTDGKLPAEDIRRQSGVSVGTNLFCFKLMGVKQNLLNKLPMIESVSVERVLPHILRIRVVEREPLAQVTVPRGMANNEPILAVWQLDTSGVVMAPLDPREAVVPLARVNPGLPLICGANAQAAVMGRRVDAEKYPEVIAALRFVEAFQKSPMLGLVDLRRVDISSPGVLVVTTGQGGQITFGLANTEQQLRRWREIYDYGKRMNKGDIASADLAVANNVPVRWTLASVVPTSPPTIKIKTKPSPKYRRKNV